MLTLDNLQSMSIQKEKRKSFLVQETIFPEPGDTLRDDQKKVFKQYKGLIEKLLILDPKATKICLDEKNKRKLSLDVIKELTLHLRMVLAGLDKSNTSREGYRQNKLAEDRREFEKYKKHQRVYFFEVFNLLVLF